MSYTLFVSAEFVILSQLTVHSFLFEFFLGNIRKVAPKYETFFCFFYIDIIACHREYWKMIRVGLFIASCYGQTILRKFCTFLFCSKSSILKSPAIINSFFLKCHLLMVFYLPISQILLRHHLVVYMSNLELCFSIFHLLFLDIMIQWHHNLLKNLV